jgi:hypothetical protein
VTAQATSRPPGRRASTEVQGRLFTLGVVAAAYLVGYLSTVHNRELFAPDTRYYAGMALWFGGTGKADAAHQVAVESAKQGWVSPGPDQLFGWGLTQPRVVYPALSTPFVKVWGIPGLAVVPALAMAGLVLLLTVLLARRWGNLAAIATMVLVCVSSQLVFYGVAMLTESLTALWSALLLALAWRHARNPGFATTAGMVALTVVSGFTRQATLIPAGAFVVAWLVAVLQRRRPNPWTVPAIAVGATAVVVQLLQMWWFPSFSQVDQLKLRTGEDTLMGAIGQAPELAWSIIKVDASRLAAADHALLVLLVLALVSMVVFWKRSESHLLLGALLAYELYNVTNGVPTTFRYGMPGLVFVAASVALLVAEAGRRFAPAREPEDPDLR